MDKTSPFITSCIITMLVLLQSGCGEEHPEKKEALGKESVDDYSISLSDNNVITEANPFADKTGLALPFIGASNELLDKTDKAGLEGYLLSLEDKGFDRAQFDLLNQASKEVNSALRHAFFNDIMKIEGLADELIPVLDGITVASNLQLPQVGKGSSLGPKKGAIYNYSLNQDISLPNCDMGPKSCDISLNVSVSLQFADSLPFIGTEPLKSGASIYHLSLWDFNLHIENFEIKNEHAALDLSTQTKDVFYTDYLYFDIFLDDQGSPTDTSTTIVGLEPNVDGYFTNHFTADDGSELDFRLSSTHTGTVKVVEPAMNGVEFEPPAAYDISGLAINYQSKILPLGSTLADGIPDDCEATYIDNKRLEKIVALECTNANDLSGIHALTGLGTLKVINGGFDTLDLSALTRLSSLQLLNTPIKNLTLPPTPALINLTIEGSKLSSLDLSLQTRLERLNLTENPIGAIKLPISSPDNDDNTKGFEPVLNTNALETITIWNSPLVTLDLSSTKRIGELQIKNSLLTSIDVFKCLRLGSLEITNSQLKSVNFGSHPELTKINLYKNQLSEIDLSSIDDSWLTEITISNNKLKSIKLPNTTRLRSLDLTSNELSEIDISNYPYLEYLKLNNNKLHKIDISNTPNLNYLYLARNDITDINFTFDSNLYHISLTQGSFPIDAITTLGSFVNADIVMESEEDTLFEFTPNITLDDVGFYTSCGLTYKDTKQLDEITLLECNNIPPTAHFEAFTGLKDLIISGEENDLAKLDLSWNKELVTLSVFYGELEKLTLPKTDTLEHIIIDGSYLLEEFNITQNPELKSLTLTFSGIKSLDTASNTKLEELTIIGNYITTLDLSKNTALTYLYISELPFFEGGLDLSSNTALTTLRLDNDMDTLGFICELCENTTQDEQPELYIF